MSETQEKRIVFLHRRGQYAGLHEIVGTTTVYTSKGEDVPPQEKNFRAWPDNRLTSAVRVRTEPYVLFVEDL